MKIRLSNLFLALLALSWALPHPAAAVRGRPTITQGAGPGLSATYYTFVSDTGTLLRGSRWSTDLLDGNGNCPLPGTSDLDSEARVANLRNLGFNALHVYGETWDQGYSVGKCQTAIDKLVKWTQDHDLYLILTIGNGFNNGSYNPTVRRQLDLRVGDN